MDYITGDDGLGALEAQPLNKFRFVATMPDPTMTTER